MPRINKRLAKHCITTPFHEGCLVMHEREVLKTGKEPRRLEGRNFSEACKGHGVVDLIEKELDKIVEALLEDKAEDPEALREKGKGIALALAIIRDPFVPDPDRETDRSMVRLGYQ